MPSRNQQALALQGGRPKLENKANELKQLFEFNLRFVTPQTFATPQTIRNTANHCLMISRGVPVLEVDRTNTILYCDSWQKTVEFYRDILKLRVTFSNDWFVEFQLTMSSFLSVANTARSTIEAVRGQGITLSWQVSDLEKMRMKFDAAGIQIGPVKQKWNADLFYVLDPEGHRIELWHPKKGALSE